MSDYLISVIIPVYNSEQYLEKSILSLVNQTIFNNIEFIFVDDGSIDKSYEIIRKYKMLYSNFILIHQDNMGVSVARNNGIKASSGKYISFFDADDIAQPKLYEKLYELIVEFDADMSIVDYSMVFNDGTKKKHRINTKLLWKDSNEAIIDFFSTNLICNNPVDKMFSAKIAKDILYPEGYAVGEDMYYIYSALKKSNRIVIDSNESLYDYVLRSTSAMKQKFSEKHFDAVKLAEIIVNDSKENEVIFPYAFANYIHEICKMFGLMYRSHSRKDYSDIANLYFQKLHKYKLADARVYMSKKHFIGLLLMRLSPTLYCIIYSIFRIG